MNMRVACLFLGVVFLSGCLRTPQIEMQQFDVEIAPVRDLYFAEDGNIQLKIKNNELKLLNIVSKQRCGGDFYTVKNVSSGQFLRVWVPMIEAVCLDSVLETILPGQEQVIETWHQGFFNETTRVVKLPRQVRVRNITELNETEVRLVRAPAGEYLIVLNVLFKDLPSREKYEEREAAIYSNLTEWNELKVKVKLG